MEQCSYGGSASQGIPPFMECVGSLLCSKEPASSPYPEPH
jgi:hypothetical protein